ncbi:MAG: mannitol dehydrogenase family protein [Christensenellaceae bacterium]|nr:mannitol dehydrogenase family protein [Christensenellaceae bacterium]
MKFDKNILSEAEFLKENGIKAPDFDIDAMKRETEDAPVWLHIGSGNIFRAYIAKIAQELLEKGLVKSGISALKTRGRDLSCEVYDKHDGLTLLVTLLPDGSSKMEIIASVAENLVFGEDTERVKKIIASPSLQMISLTITEKGYALFDSEALKSDIAEDIENGPASALKNTIAIVTSLLYDRYLCGKHPLSLVSMDNCSGNGDVLKRSVLFVAEKWIEKEFIEKDFLAYISEKVAFPCTMIDKITPAPSLSFENLEDMEMQRSKNGTACAPYVNAEAPGYLVIEDLFANGRPPMEQAGVIFTNRETVEMTERMKVSACLNPLHTALATLGCVLGYDRIYMEMRDDSLRRLAEKIGQEGIRTAPDPGIISAEAFLAEVLHERFPNPFIPDMPQRIASDTSQKIPIRYGVTISEYVRQGIENELSAIPFAIAGWLRYLTGMDDAMESFTPSPDPMLSSLMEKVSGMTAENCAEKVKPILADERIFKCDLTKTALAEKIVSYLKEMLSGKGAVRKALDRFAAE